MQPQRHPRTFALMLALAAAALAAGCASKVPLEEKKDVPVESRTGTAAGGAGAGAGGAGSSQSRVTTVTTGAGQTAGAPRVVYFDFDSYTIREEYRPLIESSAKALVAARSKRMTVEGHTDDRGGREYNLALGQKRAETVARAMALLGVNDNQIEAVSFGKERPAASGSDEAAWAKNRRAEIKDK
jgi:peptidoglycan-associated lipoprotein